MLAVRLTEVASMAEAFGALPNAGGILDQDHLYVLAMRTYHIESANKREFDRKRGKSARDITKRIAEGRDKGET